MCVPKWRILYRRLVSVKAGWVGLCRGPPISGWPKLCFRFVELRIVETISHHPVPQVGALVAVLTGDPTAVVLTS